MKLSSECRQCLERLLRQAAEFATPDPELRSKAIQVGREILDRNFSSDRIATQIAGEIHRAVRKLTGNPDPYRERKDQEIGIARLLFPQVRPQYGEDFRSCIQLSLLGNAMDFFKDLRELGEDLKKPVELTIDDVDEVEEKLKSARRILFLADNAGECFFDLPLIRKMREGAQVIYVVKGSPVQNDVTLEDLKRAGLLNRMGEVMTIGTDSVGIELDSASAQFKEQFDLADLIFGKGMGYYETLSELPLSGKIVYCLRAKCPPTANSLQVPLNSYVLKLQ